MDNNKANTAPTNGSSRRDFIKKSSIAAGITIIPASNVWGACNVTGVSGGSQTVNTTCIVKTFNGGRSPGTWKKFVKRNPTQQDYDRIATILSDVHKNDIFGESGQKKTNYYYGELKKFIYAQAITIIGDTSGQIRSKTINVGAAVDNNAESFEKHIACTYLNGLFGMNQGLSLEFTGKDGNLLFMDHIWGSAEINRNHGQVQSVLDASYKDEKRITEQQFASVLNGYGL